MGSARISRAADAPIEVAIEGHAGYYCAGMNKQATVQVHGNAGVGLAENIMSGRVVVDGSASQSAGATGHGGLVVIRGDASARAGISMKGVDIVVQGSVGHMSAFMAQKGRLVVCGDAGDALGDSIYEARLYVRGQVAGLGADCVEKERGGEHRTELGELLAEAEATPKTRTSAATARPQRSTTSTWTTRGLTDAGGRACSTATRSPRSSAPPGRHLRHPRPSAPSARCPTSTTCCSSARACRATPLEGYASAATRT